MNGLYKWMAMLLCALLLTACAADTQTAQTHAAVSAQPSETPEPSPEKQGVEKIFGKPVQIAAVCACEPSDAALYLAGAQDEADALGVRLISAAMDGGFDGSVRQFSSGGADAVIAFLPAPPDSFSALSELTGQGVPVSVFSFQKDGLPDGLSAVHYDGSGQAAQALEGALRYPPHDTPVRFITLFENTKTEAYKHYKKLADKGMVMTRASLNASKLKKTKPQAWLKDRLKDYPEGFVDAVFADSAALSVAAHDALVSAKRSDMEVFGIGLTEGVLRLLSGDQPVFAQVTGANAYFAGQLNVRMVLNMLKGMQPPSETLAPVTLEASRFAGQDVRALSSYAPEDLASKYEAEWMDELRAHYGK